MLQCLAIPTNRHCYEEAGCGINSKGECEYYPDPKLEKCLLKDRVTNLYKKK
jgi:hypothetical protein